MRHIDLFSGIGGFALAADQVFGDVEHIFCDNEPFAQEILRKHWPNSIIHGDIRTLKGDGKADLLTGGFPCQPFSVAGRRKGTEDDRYLWPEMLRVIQEFNPRWVIAENVGGLVTWSGGLVLEQVHADLEGAGYEVQAFIIPAVSVNAPHRRDRIWFVAHSRQQYGGEGGDEAMGTSEAVRTSCESYTQRRSEDDTHTYGERQQRNGEAGVQIEGQLGLSSREGDTQRGDSWDRHWHEVATKFCRVDDGVPKRLDRNLRLKGLGNAIVPQVAAEIMRSIYIVDNYNINAPINIKWNPELLANK